MGSHRKNSTRKDQPREAGESPPDPPADVEPPAPPRLPQDRETLPPLDTIRPEHVAYVRALVAKFAVTPTHEREDIAQEILIQAHRSKHSQLEPRALLFGITRHVVYRWIATHQHEQAALAAQQLQSPDEEPHPSAEEEWQAAERREVVRASIGELPDMFKDVFVRVEVAEMSMPEAAKDLGIPVNTGYTRLHLARARFAELVRRLLARRRIGKEDLAATALLAGSTSDDAHRHAAAPSPAPSWLPHLPWGATEALLLGGAFTVSLVVMPLEPDAPAVVAEPAAHSALESPTTAAPPPPPELSAGPQSATGSAPAADPSIPRDAPPLSTPAPSAPHARPTGTGTPSSGPSSQAAIRSDGAWARDIAKLALAGDRAAAAAELAAFRKAYPNSTYITRLESMVAHGAKPAPGE